MKGNGKLSENRKIWIQEEVLSTLNNYYQTIQSSIEFAGKERGDGQSCSRWTILLHFKGVWMTTNNEHNWTKGNLKFYCSALTNFDCVALSPNVRYFQMFVIPKRSLSPKKMKWCCVIPKNFARGKLLQRDKIFVLNQMRDWYNLLKVNKGCNLNFI